MTFLGYLSDSQRLKKISCPYSCVLAVIVQVTEQSMYSIMGELKTRFVTELF
jgi:hypothetical protein